MDELKETIKESNSKIDLKALSNNPKYSNSMQKRLGALMNSANSLKITQDELGRASILGVPIKVTESDTKKQMKISMS